MYKNIFFYLFLFLFSISLFSQEQEIIAPEYIQTIQFEGISQQSKIPIVRLGAPFQISFDVLNGDEADFYYEIDHYNFDWTPSNLSKGEYMEGFDDSEHRGIIPRAVEQLFDCIFPHLPTNLLFL